MAPFVLHAVVDMVEQELGCRLGNEESEGLVDGHPGENTCKSSYIEEEIYIVLTFHTLGNLISNNVYACLKKKYIKQSIFITEGNIGYYKLARSLKYIK